MGYAAAIAVLLAGVAAWLLAVRVRFSPPPRWSEAKVRFLGRGGGSQAKGDFGELLTAAILTQTGWRQLPSKVDASGHGIDGLFVRPGWLGQRVLLTETKVNVSPNKPHQLSNAKLIRALGDLYCVGALDWDTAAAIIRGLKWRSFAVKKEHWHHSLHKGVTSVRRATAKGTLTDRAITRNTAHLMECLAMMLSALDRDGRYIWTDSSH